MQSMLVITTCPKTDITPADTDELRLDQLIVRSAELTKEDLARFLKVDPSHQLLLVGASLILKADTTLKMYKHSPLTRIPGMAERIKNLSKAVVRNVVQTAKGFELQAPQEVIAERLAICKACPLFTNGVCGNAVINGQEVKGCGCNLEIKTRLAAESCPHKKWINV